MYSPTFEESRKYASEGYGAIPVSRTIPADVRTPIETLRALMREDFIIRVHKLLGMVLEEAKRKGIIEINVVRERMRTPRHPRKSKLEEDKKALKPEDVIEIVRCLDEEPITWRCILYTMVITGARRGEVCALTWDSLDFKNNNIWIDKAVRRMPHEELIIKDPKTFSSERIVYMTPDLKNLYDLLKKTQGGPASGFIFKNQRNPEMPMHPDSITSHLKTFSKKHGMEFSPKMLRASFVSFLIATLHVDPRTAQDIVGHSSIEVTMGIYARSNNGSRELAQIEMEEYIRNMVARSSDDELNAQNHPSQAISCEESE